MKTVFPPYTFFFLLLFISLHSIGQTSMPALPKEIVTTKTPAHKNAAGTRIYLVPPPGFEPSETAAGFHKMKTGVIMVVEFLGENYNVHAQKFTKENFAEKGITVKSFQDLTINGGAAKFVIVSKGGNEKSAILLFGDSSLVTMVTAVYPADDAETEAAIFRSLGTIWQDASQKPKPVSAAGFFVLGNTSRFKYVKSVNPTVHIYTPNGEDPSKTAVASMAIVSQNSTEKNMTAGELKAFSTGLLESFGAKNGAGFVTRKASADDINGAGAYEMEQIGQEEGKEVLIYSCVLNSDGFLLAITGVAKNEIETTLKELKLFSRAVRLKKYK